MYVMSMSGLDLPVLLEEFLKERRTMLRGLAHPFLMTYKGPTQTTMGVDVQQVGDTFRKFGAVTVSPSSLFQVVRYKILYEHYSCDNNSV